MRHFGFLSCTGITDLAVLGSLSFKTHEIISYKISTSTAKPPNKKSSFHLFRQKGCSASPANGNILYITVRVAILSAILWILCYTTWEMHQISGPCGFVSKSGHIPVQAVTKTNCSGAWVDVDNTMKFFTRNCLKRQRKFGRIPSTGTILTVVM